MTSVCRLLREQLCKSDVMDTLILTALINAASPPP